MVRTHNTRSKAVKAEPSKRPTRSGPAPSGLEELTYEIILEILDAAESKTRRHYAKFPELLKHVLFELEERRKSCNRQPYPPQDLLQRFLEYEQYTMNCWNDHRLGQDIPTWYGPNAPPIDLNDFTHWNRTGNFSDADESFPIRATARALGISFEEPEPMVPYSTIREAVRAYQEVQKGNVAFVDMIPLLPHSAFNQNRKRKGKEPEQKKNQGSKTEEKESERKPTNTYGKLDDAPSMNLDFPNANLTAAEIIAFLPQWMKSWGMIDRLISNGGTAAIIEKMVNTFREMPKGAISANTVLRMMQCAVSQNPDTRFRNWYIGGHKVSKTWDPTDISVRGFQPPRLTHPRKGSAAAFRNQKPKAIPFRDLANDVKEWPQDHDTLDLTRCIQYHVDHPKEKWFFPNDFATLLQHIGGPAPVRPENHDSAIFDRWAKRSALAIKTNNNKRKRQVFQDSEEEEEELELIDGNKNIQIGFASNSNSDEGEVEELDFDKLDDANSDEESDDHSDNSDPKDDMSLAKRQRINPLPTTGRKPITNHGIGGRATCVRHKLSKVGKTTASGQVGITSRGRKGNQPTLGVSKQSQYPSNLLSDPRPYPKANTVESSQAPTDILAEDQENAEHELPTEPDQDPVFNIDPELLAISQTISVPIGPMNMTLENMDPQQLALEAAIARQPDRMLPRHISPNEVIAIDVSGNGVIVDRAQRDPQFFDPDGYQYLHTMVLPPPHYQHKFYENVRWAHRERAPMDFWTDRPENLDTIAMIRAETGWLSEELHASM